MSKKKFTIKEKSSIKAKSKDNKNYKIDLKKIETEEREEWKAGDTITISSASIVELGEDGKDKDGTKKDDASAKLIYKEGFFTRYFEISEVDGKVFEEKERKEVSVEGFSSFRYPFWIAIVIFVVAVIGLIWWWISSSRKEEEEEKGL